jgi:hypothetical protein
MTENPKELIDRFIENLTDWRGEILAKARRLIHEADPEILEEWKWRGAPVWSHDGIVIVGNAFKGKVKLVFYRGASIPDPDHLFNAEMNGNQWRSIEYREGESINEDLLKKLIRSAIEFNQEHHAKK